VPVDDDEEADIICASWNARRRCDAAPASEGAGLDGKLWLRRVEEAEGLNAGRAGGGGLEDGGGATTNAALGSGDGAGIDDVVLLSARLLPRI
jgi:hypothetical protein